MPVELKVPKVGESITEVQIAEWLKAEGDPAKTDETIVMIDTEKTTVELPAPISGTITKIVKQSGETAVVGEVIGYMEEGQATTKTAAKPTSEKTPQPEKIEGKEKPGEPKPEWEKPSGKEEQKASPEKAVVADKDGASKTASPSDDAPPRVMPAAQRVLAENGLRAENIASTGPGGRVLKEDVLRHVEREQAAIPAPPQEARAPASSTPSSRRAPIAEQVGGEEEVVPMTLLRRRVAERLVTAQQTAALLTTFNEIDMSFVMALRQEHRDAFQERYGIKLGFMSFFVKATVDALKQLPQINAEIRGNDIVYRNYYDIGVAIGSGKGLVVPVLRHAERLSFAEIEMAIADFANRAKATKLTPDELTGGTFTITNGGIYGSLLSTPIVNPPQSGILGMHAIQERPIAHNGQVVIRPMMYIALTYDHRLVDGREAVTFLKRIKDCIETPARMLLEV